MALLDTTGLNIVLAPDGLQASVQIRCPLPAEDMPSRRQVRQELEAFCDQQGILKRFLQEDELEQAVDYLLGQSVPATDVSAGQLREMDSTSGFEWHGLLAEGLAPQHGRDSRVQRYFHDELQPGQVGVDGRMDYRERGYIQAVEAQALLAELFKPTEGEAGMTVLGEPIPADPGQMRETLEFDEQTIDCHEHDDRYEFRARITGCVQFRESRLGLSLQTTIDSDVGLETGNIAAVGDLTIDGNVQEGFRVETTGTLEIRGDVQRGAFLKAHNINVTGVCHGQVLATMNVIMVSAESTYVRAGNMIVVERATSSRLEAASILCDSLHSSACWASRLMQIERVRESKAAPSVLRLAPHPLSHSTWQVFKTELAAMRFELDWHRRLRQSASGEGAQQQPSQSTDDIQRLGHLCQIGQRAQRRWLANKSGRMQVRQIAARTRIRFYGRTYEMDAEAHRLRIRWDEQAGSPVVQMEEGGS